MMAVPSEWQPEVSRYRYVYSDDRTVLVEPSSGPLVRVIEWSVRGGPLVLA